MELLISAGVNVTLSIKMMMIIIIVVVVLEDVI